MTTFIASAFNAETDSDRPVIDSQFEYTGSKYTVKKVNHLLVSDIISGRAKEPEKEEFDTFIVRSHACRPAVVWVVWGQLV